MALIPRRERAISRTTKTIVFPIEFVKNNPEYSYHGFQKSSGPGKARWKFLPKTCDGHVECLFLQSGRTRALTWAHGLLQELQTCPPFAAVPACLPTVYLDLDDRDCHDTCKNLYFFVAFPCSVLRIRSQREKDVRGLLDPRSNLKNWESQR